MHSKVALTISGLLVVLSIPTIEALADAYQYGAPNPEKAVMRYKPSSLFALSSRLSSYEATKFQRILL